MPSRRARRIDLRQPPVLCRTQQQTRTPTHMPQYLDIPECCVIPEHDGAPCAWNRHCNRKRSRRSSPAWIYPYYQWCFYCCKTGSHGPEEEVGHIDGLSTIASSIENMNDLITVTLKYIPHELELFNLEHMTRYLSVHRVGGDFLQISICSWYDQ